LPHSPSDHAQRRKSLRHCWAEKAVYRSDLKVNPGNPRSLHGLARSLRAEGKKQEAAKYENQFKSAWHYADVAPEPVRFHDARTASSGTEGQKKFSLRSLNPYVEVLSTWH
jgi:hypothetical protein